MRLGALKAPEQAPDRPQVPAEPSQVRRRLGDPRSDLGVEPDPEPIVEPDSVDLARVHDPDLTRDDDLQGRVYDLPTGRRSPPAGGRIEHEMRQASLVHHSTEDTNPEGESPHPPTG